MNKQREREIQSKREDLEEIEEKNQRLLERVKEGESSNKEK